MHFKGLFPSRVFTHARASYPHAPLAFCCFIRPRTQVAEKLQLIHVCFRKARERNHARQGERLYSNSLKYKAAMHWKGLVTHWWPTFCRIQLIFIFDNSHVVTSWFRWVAGPLVRYFHLLWLGRYIKTNFVKNKFPVIWICDQFCATVLFISFFTIFLHLYIYMSTL